MAKDTEKLIRQLSLISYLMAERRPVTALEIRRDVEGYSGMNEDAFARRFYADRSELESLRIQLTVERPADGAAEQENYSLRPENFHLPPIEFTDKELAALQTALSLLDGEFAYAEPLRLALQQITWGRPSPLRAPEQRSVALGITASAGGHELSARLAKIETAIFRNKTIVFDYYTMERDEVGARRVDPYHLLFQGGQFYLLGYAHEREAIRVFRLSRIRGKVVLRDQGRARLPPPGGLRPARLRQPRRLAARRGARAWPRSSISERIAWQIERHFGRYGEIPAAEPRERERRGETVFRTGLLEPARARLVGARPGRATRACSGPEELVERARAARWSCSRSATARPRRAAPPSARRSRRRGRPRGAAAAAAPRAARRRRAGATPRAARAAARPRSARSASPAW